MQKGNKTYLIVGGLVLAAVGLLGYRNFISTSGGDGGSGIPCINPALPMPADLHVHPQLKIMIDGAEVPVPANIGIETFGCERALHTHDATGELHIEPNFAQDFTLGQFFMLWGKPFSKTQLFDKTADAGHEIIMTVDGAANEEYSNLILKDKQNIVLEYRTRAAE